MKSGQRWVGWGGGGLPVLAPACVNIPPRPLRLPALASHRPLSLATSVPDLARSGGPVAAARARAAPGRRGGPRTLTQNGQMGVLGFFFSTHSL